MPLGERGMDALRELFNIGAGNAATSLSQMLGGERVLVEVPDVKTVATTSLGEQLGKNTRVLCAVGFTITGGFDARLLMVFDERSAARLASVLLGRPAPEDKDEITFDAAARSALDETGNIVASSFVSGLGRLTRRRIMPSVPSSGVAEATAVVGQVLKDLGPHADESIVCHTDLQTRGTRIHGQLLLLPERRSLSEILNALGVDPAT